MPNISLPTGKVIYVSTFEYYFMLDEEAVDMFFQSCIADDLGIEVQNPFSNKCSSGELEIDEYQDIEIPDLKDYDKY